MQYGVTIRRRRRTGVSDQDILTVTSRERLLAAAEAIIVERGFHGTSVADMSERSGVPVGQIYRDFTNKAAIIAAIVERDCGRCLSHDRPIANDPAGLADWVFKFAIRWDTNGLAMHHEIVAEAVRNASVKTIVRSADERLRRRLLSALSSALQDAASHDIAALADLILCLSAGIGQRAVLMSDESRQATIASATALVTREIARIA